jgi:hypothetical protein
LDKNKKEKRKDTTAYIRNEGDEPMDLLSRSIAGNVASESSFFLPLRLLPPLPPLLIPPLPTFSYPFRSPASGFQKMAKEEKE